MIKKALKDKLYLIELLDISKNRSAGFLAKTKYKYRNIVEGEDIECIFLESFWKALTRFKKKPKYKAKKGEQYDKELDHFIGYTLFICERLSGNLFTHNIKRNKKEKEMTSIEQNNLEIEDPKQFNKLITIENKILGEATMKLSEKNYEKLVERLTPSTATILKMTYSGSTIDKIVEKMVEKFKSKQGYRNKERARAAVSWYLQDLRKNKGCTFDLDKESGKIKLIGVEEDEEAPKKKKKIKDEEAPKKKKKAKDEEEDEEAPKKKKKAKDEEEDEEAPKKPKGKAKSREIEDDD